jgi:hypothetical protein
MCIISRKYKNMTWEGMKIKAANFIVTLNYKNLETGEQTVNNAHIN